MRFARTMGLVALLLTAVATLAGASLPPGPGKPPSLVAPEPLATEYEGGLRFAWVPPAGTARQVLVVSTKPFDATGWTTPSTEVTALATTKPSALLSETGLTLDRDMPLYWAVGTARTATGPLRFSPTRTLNVLRKFTNRVQPSPYLVGSTIGKASPVSDGEPYRIQLAAGYTIDPAVGAPALPEELTIHAAPSAGQRSWLLYYGDADPAAVRQSILASGGIVVTYVPDHAFLVRYADARTPQINAVSWMGVYQPAYKLSSALDRRGPGGPMTVLAFPDADVAALRTALTGAGAQVLETSDNGINKILRIEASGFALTAIAGLNDVAWVEPYVQPTTNNGTVQWIDQTFGTGNRRLWDLGIAGQGEIIHHSDSGINMSHEMQTDGGVPINDFGDYPLHRKVVHYERGSDNPNIVFGDHGSFHGTHTSGTAAGNDLTPPLAGQDGVAHFAKIWHSDLSGVSLGTGLAPPLDLNDLFQPSYTGNAAGAARISTNSWGSNVSGAYTVNSQTCDQFMWNHPDYLICFANGNAGPSTFSVGSPATAKNIVSVGGTLNGSIASAKTIYSSTSRGPSADGRRKPTVCSPASTVTSSTTGTSSYSGFAGTSMASPNMAGTAALLREYLREGWYPTGAKVPANGFTPSAALLKAMLVNSATTDFASFPAAPDNNIGWGRICADSVLYFAGDVKRLLLVDQTEGIGHGDAIEYQVNVVNNSSALEVALCWTDFPSASLVGLQLVNNLNLTVTNGVVTYRGNVYSAGNSTTGGSYDIRNTEETVRVAIPAPGLWTVRVEGANVPFGPQPFGLVVTGGVGVSAGAVALDRPTYSSTGPTEVQVTDTDAGGSVSVTMSSTSEPAGETLVIPGSDGVFNGSIPLSPYAGTVGDGILHVSHGDVITATYNDASPVATIVATAVVSFNPPVITGVAASVSQSGTNITWITDKSASSQVYYGTTPALGSVSPLSPLAVFSHAATLTGLTPGQTYYFDVESTDLQGNTTRDDRGGLHYTVTAPQPGDLLLVYGGDTFERPTYYTAALSELGWSYEVWSGSQSDSPVLGDLSSGMRSYRAIWWQPGLELYPPVSPAAQDAITQYLDGGGRLAITGHDIGWALADPTSPYYSPAGATWVLNTLRTTYQLDPATWTSVSGIASDPISDPYTGGLPYAEHRAGASGDEIDAAGGAVASWFSGSVSPDHAGIRWDSGGPLGTPGTAVWAGAPSRLAAMYFEWTSIDPTAIPSSPSRRDVMRRTLAWLLGRDKPTATLLSPNGGEVITTDNVDITWNEATDGGTNVGSRTLEYSINNGLSWTTISASPGTSPYSWDLTTVPNSNQALVRLTLVDDGTPTLKSSDVSNAVFAIQRVGGDALGPVVVAGSVVSGPNPIVAGNAATLTATVSDSTTGQSNVAAAEWSTGAVPAPAGSGTPMTGTFTTPKVAVSVPLPTVNFLPGPRKLWVRGQDAIGNWGPASVLNLVVNTNGVVGVQDGIPAVLELRQNAPNPVTESTIISFGLPTPTTARLDVYDVTGRRVKELVNGSLPAGTHVVSWNRVDENGRPVKSGVFYYRMVAAGKTLVRQMVVLN